VSSGSKVRLGDPESIVPSLRSLVDAGVTQMNFMTNELNPSLSYMRRLVQSFGPILSNYPEIGWFTYLRPDAMDEEDLVALRRLGCRLIRWGVETGSQSLSDRMQKDYHMSTVARVLHAAAKADIANHINLLLGYPGETDDDVNETLRFVTENASVIHSVRINPFYLPPGTKLEREPQRFGLRLLEFKSGYWTFEREDGVALDASVVQQRIERVGRRLIDLGIGFAGVLPFEFLNALCRESNRDSALAALRASQPFLWTEASPDGLKAQFGKYKMKTDWSETIFQRGRNYQTVLCND